MQQLSLFTYLSALEHLHPAPLTMSPLSHPKAHLPLTRIPKESTLPFVSLILVLQFKQEPNTVWLSMGQATGMSTPRSMCLK